jgi:F-type H+-transporting ATPase subunit gamma
MTNARDIQLRIKAVRNIGKVTRAMEAVSANKMRRAESAQRASRVYAHMAAEVLGTIAATRGAPVEHELLTDHGEGIPAIVLITPDRGLTGGLVLEVLETALRRARDLGDETAWIAVGSKGAEFLRKYRANVVAEYRVSDDPAMSEWIGAAEVARGGFLAGQFAAVYLAYAPYGASSIAGSGSGACSGADAGSDAGPGPGSAERPGEGGGSGEGPGSPTRGDRLLLERLLPLTAPRSAAETVAAYTFEPSTDEVLELLLQRLVDLRLYQAILEAKASEHMARMVAMRNASQASTEIVEELTLSYNRARQEAITSELLDITGGAEALRGRAGRRTADTSRDSGGV